MMALGPIGFLSPWLLTALLALPVIWWLLRVTPPGPQHIFFPATRLLLGIERKEEDRAHSPWWLTLIRLMAAAAIILALSRPVLNPETHLSTEADLQVIVVDNGFGAADDWGKRRATLTQLLQRAEENSQPVLLLTTAEDETVAPAHPESAQKALERASSLTPRSYPPDRPATLKRLQQAGLKRNEIRLSWLSDGLDYGHARAFRDGLIAVAGGSDHVDLYTPGAASDGPLALAGSIDGQGAFSAVVISPGDYKHEGAVIARDDKGRVLAEQSFALAAGEDKTTVDFELPLELRNQIARLEIKGRASAAGTYLIDSLSSRRRIGLLSGDTAEQAQPLLSSLYYIRKALSPYAEITNVDDRNASAAINKLLDRDVTVLALADIGRLGFETSDQLDNWMQRGGILIRFAGPHLEQGGDDLLPVPLRHGGRALGGALSWSQPQRLADFEQGSPFFGLAVPQDVKVARQVLADPSRINDETLIWARLQDSTPLVTARRIGRGLLVLFHVTANSSWSNLPHSGLFVDMLRRIDDLSTGVIAPKDAGGQPQTADGSATNVSASPTDTPMLTPMRLMNGFGVLGKPGPLAEPLRLNELETYRPSAAHPPGFYGTGGRNHAVNIASADSKLRPLPSMPSGLTVHNFTGGSSQPLAPALFTAALLLFLTDGLIVALMRGLSGIGGKPRHPATAALILAAALLFTPSSNSTAFADGDPLAEAFALKMSLNTHLAFVRNADPVINRNSQLGLKALSEELSRRTAFEPAEPVGVDIARDELAFFPLLYWPVPDQTEDLDEKTIARIDAYMKQGGVILFDTRNQLSNFLTSDLGGAQTALGKLLERMDIPPLEPVPADHVLGRSFYLLDGFPGRWDGGRLWAEASSSENVGTGTARSSDGVSAILITSNDMAAAWARDISGAPLYPVVPGGERQREMAYRAGINIVMYALTGNYKSDQVHLPALMRRLGQ